MQFQTNIYHKTSRDRFEVSETGTVDLTEDFERIGSTEETELHKIFELFNTVYRPFWENPEVTLADGLEGARSLSVGDVIQTPEGDLFEVAPVGFNPVKWESKS